MTDEQSDPEVERLAGVIVGALSGHQSAPGAVDVAAAAVVADLRARYILVPREGATETIDWGVRMDGQFRGRAHWTSHANGRRKPDGGEQDARDWAASSEGAMHVVRRQVVHGAPEEAAP